MQNVSEFFVHLVRDGVTESFGPGEEIPEWAAKLITNPFVVGEAPEPVDADESSSDGSAIPARSGAGSGRGKWLEYATAQHVQVDDDASRDDIVAACAAAGIPVD